MRALVISCVLLTGCTGTMDAYFAQDVVEKVTEEPYVAGTTNPRQYLDLYLPREVDNFPVVVFVHGGYWIAQDKDFFQPFVGLYGNVGIALARRGIGVAVINYRLVPDVTLDDELADVAAAVGWVQGHIAARGGDPTRMVLAGHSAGGHMTALLAFDDARLAAAGVDLTGMRGYAPLSPILDVQHMVDHPPPRPGFTEDIVVPVFGTDFTRNSPRTYFRSTVSPLLVIMGDADEAFLLEQLPVAVADLEALGAPVSFHTLVGHDHEDIVLDFDQDGDAMTPLLSAFVDDVTR